MYSPLTINGGDMEEPDVEQVAWVFKKILTHMREGGTFRYLIYERMGFGPEAYEPLYQAGGMAISNLCNAEITEDEL